MPGVESTVNTQPDPGPAGLAGRHEAAVLAASLEPGVEETLNGSSDSPAGPPSGSGPAVSARSPGSGLQEPVKAPSDRRPVEPASGRTAAASANVFEIGIEKIVQARLTLGAAGSPSSYGSVLIATAIFLPVVATLFTLLFVLLSGQDSLSAWIPIWATSVAAALWLALSVLFQRFADARHAIPSSYGELQPRLSELETCLANVRAEMESTADGGKKVAYDEAVKEASEIRKDLATRGIAWLLASGYNSLWGRLYHAEEALIEVAPRNKVLEGAYRDEARLAGSEIKNRDDLRDMLRKALASVEQGGQASGQVTGSIGQQPGNAPGTAAGRVEPENIARTALRHVRKSLDEYRNARWNGLILARNRLLATFGLTGMFIFALLSIAIMFGARKPAVVAAAVFYMVGAIVGLGNRLRGESQAESAIADYGLSAARLITIPLFSGLGALGGLLLVPYLGLATTMVTGKPPVEPPQAPGLMQKVVPDQNVGTPSAPSTRPGDAAAKPPTPAAAAGAAAAAGSDNAARPFAPPAPTGSPAAKAPAPAAGVTDQADKAATAPSAPAAPAGSAAAKAPAPAAGATDDASKKATTPPDTRDLKEIFDLSKNMLGFLVAALFGLVPGLLFERLQQQADQYKADLKSTRSTERT